MTRLGPSMGRMQQTPHHLEPQDLGLEVFWHEQGTDFTRAIVDAVDDRPFDPDSERERAQRIARYVYCRKNGLLFGRWIFEESPFEGVPSRERAAWWLQYLKDPDNTGLDLPADYVVLPGPLAVMLDVLTGGDTLPELIATFENCMTQSQWCAGGSCVHTHSSRFNWLGLRALWPHVDEAQRAELASVVDARWWFHGQLTQVEWRQLPYLSALLGTHADDTRKAIDALEDGWFTRKWVYDEPGLSLFASTPEERVREARRLGVSLIHPDVALAWLQNTGSPGFELLAEQIKGNTVKHAATLEMELLTARLHGPGAVLGFTRLLDSSYAQKALEWLQANRPLIYAAKLSAQDAAPLSVVLRPVSTRELKSVVKDTSDGVRAVIEEVLAEREFEPFDPQTPWWAEAAQGTEPAAVQRRLAAMLPTFVVNERQRLAEPELQLLLALLQRWRRNDPLVIAIREHVPEELRDRFAIQLLETWLARGTRAYETWLMWGAGCVGGDGFVRRIEPLVNYWRERSQYNRAVDTLKAIRDVGSDAALKALMTVASTMKTAMIKKAAGELIEDVASELGLTRDQLEDRSVADIGLDARGTREFSYGTRRFRAALTPKGTIAVRKLDNDGRPTGKTRTTLPPVTGSDDSRLANQARAEFKELKKTLTGSAKLQRTRLEQAMLVGRRWSAEEFQHHLAPKPIFRVLLQAVVWGVLDGATRVGLGRLDEEGILVDADDAPISLAGRELYIVHPAELSDDERARWSRVQADYELVESFPQLSRPWFELPASQGEDLELHGLRPDSVDAGYVVGAREKHRWEPGKVLDGGVYHLMGRYFPQGDVTAVIQLTPGLGMGPVTAQFPQRISSVYLLRGAIDPKALGMGAMPGRSLSPETVAILGHVQHVPWAQAPRAVVSEVLATINAIKG